MAGQQALISLPLVAKTTFGISGVVSEDFRSSLSSGSNVAVPEYVTRFGRNLAHCNTRWRRLSEEDADVLICLLLSFAC